MAVTYYERSSASNISGVNQLLTAYGVQSTGAVAIARGATNAVIASWISEPSNPSLLNWGTGNAVVSAVLTAGTGVTYVTINARISRVSADGATTRATVSGSPVSAQTSGTKTFTISIASLTQPTGAAATDRFKVELLVTNTRNTAYSITLAQDDAACTTTAPFTPAYVSSKTGAGAVTASGVAAMALSFPFVGDEHQLSVDSNSNVLAFGTTSTPIGVQSVTLPSCRVVSLAAFWKRPGVGGYPSDGFCVELCDIAGNILGRTLDFAGTFVGKEFCTFSSPVSVPAGVYVFCFKRNGASDNNKYYGLGMNTTNPYAGGCAASWSGTLPFPAAILNNTGPSDAAFMLTYRVAPDLKAVGVAVATAQGKTTPIVKTGAGTAAASGVAAAKFDVSFAGAGSVSVSSSARAIVETIEAINPTPTGDTEIGKTTAKTSLGQEITLGATTAITAIEFQVWTVGNPPDSLVVEIADALNGGNVLAATAPVFTLPTSATSPGWTRFRFGSPVTLASGVKYYFRIQRGSAVDNGKYFGLKQSGDSYAGGTLTIFNGATWSEDPTSDLVFRLIAIQSVQRFEFLGASTGVARFSSSALWAAIIKFAGGGVATASGEAAMAALAAFSFTVSGAAQASGEAALTSASVLVGQGSCAAASAATFKFEYTLALSGTAILSGAAASTPLYLYAASGVVAPFLVAGAAVSAWTATFASAGNGLAAASGMAGMSSIVLHAGEGVATFAGDCTSAWTAICANAGGGTVATSGTAAVGAAGEFALSGAGATVSRGAAINSWTAIYASAGSGQLNANGAAELSTSSIYTGTGAITASGIAGVASEGTAAYAGAGAIQAAGTATFVFDYTLIGNGQAVASGVAAYVAEGQIEVVEIGTGVALISGAVTANFSHSFATAGTAQAYGAAAYAAEYTFEMSAGAVATSGTATMLPTQFYGASGTLLASGMCGYQIGFVLPALGSGRLSGQALSAWTATFKCAGNGRAQLPMQADWLAEYLLAGGGVGSFSGSASLARLWGAQTIGVLDGGVIPYIVSWDGGPTAAIKAQAGGVTPSIVSRDGGRIAAIKVETGGVENALQIVGAVLGVRGE